MSVNHLSRIKKGKDVLLALKEYGPLTRKTLLELVGSVKSKRNLSKVLSVLEDHKLIRRRMENLAGGQAAFYQINQSLEVRDILTAYLDCQSVEIEQRPYRYRELYHEQVVASLVFHLRKLFPKALFYRDFQLGLDNHIKTILPNINNVESARPDVLMVFWDLARRPVSIAVEFERSQKSKNRLYEKLKTYSAESKLDGVLYINSEDNITENLRHIYSSQILERSLRIKHYGNHFLLFSIFSGSVRDSLDLCFNIDNTVVDLKQWINVLTSTEEHLRRDQHFNQTDTASVLSLST